jgi:hypothetical protein
MACLELRRVAIRVPIRIELVHIVDNTCAIAGSLEPGIDLIVARHGFLLWSGKWKVHVAVMDNTVPVMEVSQPWASRQCFRIASVLLNIRRQ